MDQETNKPADPNTFPTAPVAEKSPLAMIVGVVGFIIILLGVGWYMMGMTNPMQPENIVTAPPTAEQAAATDTTGDTAAAALSVQGSSDDVSEIDADLKATDLNSLNDIDKI